MQKKKFSIRDFFSKWEQITLTKGILNWKLQFFVVFFTAVSRNELCKAVWAKFLSLIDFNLMKKFLKTIYTWHLKLVTTGPKITDQNSLHKTGTFKKSIIKKSIKNTVFSSLTIYCFYSHAKQVLPPLN